MELGSHGASPKLSTTLNEQAKRLKKTYQP